MDQIKIIPAQEEHIEAACQIAIKAWTPIREIFRRDLGDELYEAHFADWQKPKRASVEKAILEGRGFVAVLGEKVVGFVTYSLNHQICSGTICNNAVDPDCRGMGIGPKLYDKVLQTMKEQGMEYATVTTGLDDGHAPARRAYEKMGFEKNLPSIKYFKKL
jgi:ribosomal protein S18 acetylase RimI-like enzyme